MKIKFDRWVTWAGLRQITRTNKSPFAKFCRICGEQIVEHELYVRRGDNGAHVSCVERLKKEQVSA